MRRLLREPLLHILLGGALLFVLYGMVASDPPRAPDRIVVDGERIARLALGLDRDDLVVRRRLRQQVEFLHLDLAEREAPTEAELAAFLADKRERFEDPARLSFRQLFVSPDAGSAAARQRAEELLTMFRAGAEPEGDRTLLPGRVLKASEREVASAFGAGFAADLFAATDDAWIGPVASAYGLHLVRVDERILARMPELGQVRRSVELEFEAARRAEANERFLEELRGRYAVEIHMPRADAAPRLGAAGG